MADALALASAETVRVGLVAVMSVGVGLVAAMTVASFMVVSVAIAIATARKAAIATHEMRDRSEMLPAQEAAADPVTEWIDQIEGDAVELLAALVAFRFQRLLNQQIHDVLR